MFRRPLQLQPARRLCLRPQLPAPLPASAAATASPFDLADLVAPFPLSAHSGSTAVHRYGDLLDRCANLLHPRQDELIRLRVWRRRVLHAE